MRWLEARNSRKRSRRSPEALTAGGPTLRGWHDLLNVRQKRAEPASGEACLSVERGRRAIWTGVNGRARQ